MRIYTAWCSGFRVSGVGVEFQGWGRRMHRPSMYPRLGFILPRSRMICIFGALGNEDRLAFDPGCKSASAAASASVEDEGPSRLRVGFGGVWAGQALLGL